MATRVDRERPAAGPLITGFSGRGFKVDGTARPGGVLLTPTSAHDWPAPPALEALTPADLEAILAIDPVPEFLLLGTGPSTRRPAPAFMRALEERGIGCDPMDSRAAARAWGLLRAEERWIVAALMPL